MMPDFWRFIPQDEYRRPPELTSEKANRSLRSLWANIRRSGSEQGVSVKAELTSAPQYMLDRVAPEPSWTAAVEALERGLGQWLEDAASESRIRILVGPPGSGTGQTLSIWAEGRRLPLLDPPGVDEITGKEGVWLKRVQQRKEPLLVLPGLEKCFLRHHNGLNFLRRLLDFMLQNDRKWVLGSNSWGWAYLCKAVQIDSFPVESLALQAFDSSVLQVWLSELASGSFRRPPVFRSSADGVFVIPPEDREGGGEGG